MTDNDKKALQEAIDRMRRLQPTLEQLGASMQDFAARLNAAAPSAASLATALRAPVEKSLFASSEDKSR